MHSFTVTIIIGGYMFRLQSSHRQSVYIRCKKRNYIRLLFFFDSFTGHLDGIKYTTSPNQPQRCILTDYFNNYKFSKAQIIRSLIMVIKPKHVGAVLM
jgi:hypothetical protein